MKKIYLALLVFGVAFAVLSCRSFQITGVEISTVQTDAVIVGHFDTSIWVNKFLGPSGGMTMFNVTADATDPLIIDEIRRQIAMLGGTRAINVTVESRATFGQMLLSGLTNPIAWIGALTGVTIPVAPGAIPVIYGPTTVRVRGTVVR